MTTATATTLVQVKECDLCKQVVRIVSDPVQGRETAFDHPSGEEHDCWELPPGADVLILEDDCDC